MRNLSVQKRLEAELRQQSEALSAANANLAKAARLKDEFLASMSHELRTPLNGILGMTEAVLEGVYGPVTPDQTSALKDVEGCGRHLLSLINDILDLSKVEAGKLTLEYADVSAEDVCQASLRMVKEVAQKKRIRTELVVDVPSPFRADQRRLKQILVNLLSNAVKFTPDGGTVGLTAKANPDGGMVRFEVSDTGIGIKPEDLTLLFRPFQQIDSKLSREYSGTGLGLSLVRRLAELHGGGVAVESTPGVGSRFSVTMPYQPVDPSIEQPPATQAARKAVVVEDQSVVADQLARYLSELGVRVVAHDRIAGLKELVARESPDFVLLDRMLPDGDGLSVVAAIRAATGGRRVPVVVVSDLDRPPSWEGTPVDGYLVKPVSRDALRALMEGAGVAFAPTPAKADAPLVLLVEDNEVGARTVGGYLVAVGYRLAVARSGADGLDLARSLHPAVVLMDIQMPGMDGLEATRRLRADSATAKIPVIALTALAMPGDRDRCLAAGADEYLAKPVSLKELRATIDRLIAGGRP